MGCGVASCNKMDCTSRVRLIYVLHVYHFLSYILFKLCINVAISSDMVHIPFDRCGRVQKNDWNMSHRLYQRIESVVQQISPQLDIFDKASLQSNSEKYIAITKSNNLPKYQPITCNPNLRLYKYTKGQWFGRHVDDSNRIDIPSVSTLSKCNNTSMNAPTFAGAANVKEAQTEITVLFYLSSCRGGATTFHPPHQRKKGGASVSFTPEEGAVLLHVHGDHCLEHEAEPVLEGVKYGEIFDTLNMMLLVLDHITCNGMLFTQFFQ